MINRIENLITKLINDFLSQGIQTEICLNNYNASISSGNTNLNHNEVKVNENNYIDISDNGQRTSTSFKKLYYCRFYSRQRFASLLFVIAEVHELFLARSHCTLRQLYYRNVDIECNTLQIERAVIDACQALGTTSWNLGIFAAGKCFVSGISYVLLMLNKHFKVTLDFIIGPLLVYMSNGDIIDCNEYKGPTLMPPNFTYIDKFETAAHLVLVVEKDTVFQNLIACNIFSLLNGDIILITARGYPDICTRWILHKLWIENFLNIYAFVDGDPFGIEIMLIYRYGSLAQGPNTINLTCPQLKWLGIHPSEITHITAPIEPLSPNDRKKIKSLLRRSYLDDEIRTELLILQNLQCKVKIDNISRKMFSTFTCDYIINKIKRQILL